MMSNSQQLKSSLSSPINSLNNSLQIQYLLIKSKRQTSYSPSKSKSKFNIKILTNLLLSNKIFSFDFYTINPKLLLLYHIQTNHKQKEKEFSLNVDSDLIITTCLSLIGYKQTGLSLLRKCIENESNFEFIKSNLLFCLEEILNCLKDYKKEIEEYEKSIKKDDEIILNFFLENVSHVFLDCFKCFDFSCLDEKYLTIFDLLLKKKNFIENNEFLELCNLLEFTFFKNYKTFSFFNFLISTKNTKTIIHDFDLFDFCFNYLQQKFNSDLFDYFEFIFLDSINNSSNIVYKCIELLQILVSSEINYKIISLLIKLSNFKQFREELIDKLVCDYFLKILEYLKVSSTSDREDCFLLFEKLKSSNLIREKYYEIISTVNLKFDILWCLLEGNFSFYTLFVGEKCDLRYLKYLKSIKSDLIDLSNEICNKIDETEFVSIALTLTCKLDLKLFDLYLQVYFLPFIHYLHKQSTVNKLSLSLNQLNKLIPYINESKLILKIFEVNLFKVDLDLEFVDCDEVLDYFLFLKKKFYKFEFNQLSQERVFEYFKHVDFKTRGNKGNNSEIKESSNLCLQFIQKYLESGNVGWLRDCFVNVCNEKLENFDLLFDLFFSEFSKSEVDLDVLIECIFLVIYYKENTTSNNFNNCDQFEEKSLPLYKYITQNKIIIKSDYFILLFVYKQWIYVDLINNYSLYSKELVVHYCRFISMYYGFDVYKNGLWRDFVVLGRCFEGEKNLGDEKKIEGSGAGEGLYDDGFILFVGDYVDSVLSQLTQSSNKIEIEEFELFVDAVFVLSGKEFWFARFRGVWEKIIYVFLCFVVNKELFNVKEEYRRLVKKVFFCLFRLFGGFTIVDNTCMNNVTSSGNNSSNGMLVKSMDVYGVKKGEFSIGQLSLLLDEEQNRLIEGKEYDLGLVELVFLIWARECYFDTNHYNNYDDGFKGFSGLGGECKQEWCNYVEAFCEKVKGVKGRRVCEFRDMMRELARVLDVSVEIN